MESTRRLFRTRRVSVIFPEITLQSSLAKIKGSNSGRCSIYFTKCGVKKGIQRNIAPGRQKALLVMRLLQSEEPSVAPTLYFRISAC
jgi:hypothetical protein